jgi:hypothetical protein
MILGEDKRFLFYRSRERRRGRLNNIIIQNLQSQERYLTFDHHLDHLQHDHH